LISETHPKGARLTEFDTEAAPTSPDTEALLGVVVPKRHFVQDLFSVVTGRVLTKACQLLVGIVVARLVGPEGRGLIASLYVASDLALTFSQFGMREAVAYAIGKKIHTAAEIVPTLLGLVFFASLTAMSACMAYYYVTGLTDQSWVLLALALAPIPFNLLTNYAAGVFLGKEMIVRFNRVNWMPMALNLVLVIAVGWVGGLGINGVMLAAALATLFNCSYAIYLLRSVTPLRIGFNRKLATNLSRRGVVYAAAVFMLVLNLRLPILLLHNLSNLTEVGIYAVGQSLAFMVWEIPGVLSNLIFSRGVNAKDSGAFSDKVVILTRFVVLAGILVALGCAVVGPVIIPWIYGGDFAASATVLTILLPGTVAFMAFRIFHTDLAGRGHPWVAIPIIVPCMLANAGLGIFIIPEYGAEGAAVLTSASYLLAGILYIVVYARMTKRSFLSVLLYRRSDFSALLQRLRFSALLQRLRIVRK
jgi:O-antigen/teichoic acid export membrane protein